MEEPTNGKKNMKKNTRTIVFSFDGTGNEPSDANKYKEDESISNILKLHILMGGGLNTDETLTKTPSGCDQITFYFNGIGTIRGSHRIPLLGKLHSLVNMTVAPTMGDARTILNEAKEDFDEVEIGPEDKIVIFGFSRGAALARKFASKILSEDKNCKVSFLGVFDTVAAMDGMHRKGETVSSDVVFENGTLNERIEKAVHIMSIDENRVTFVPTLINKDDKNSDRILEVWFPGVHSDIGGGYWFDGLSDSTLKFMMDECKRALGEDILIEEGNHHNIERLLLEQGDILKGVEVDDIAINPISIGPVHNHSGLKSELIGLGLRPREIYVSHNDRRSSNKKDYPILHHSVNDRFNSVSNYRPPSLRGLKFKLLEQDGSISEPIHGISGLRERIEKSDNAR